MSEKEVDNKAQAIPTSVQKQLEKRSSKEYVNEISELYTDEEKQKQKKVEEEYLSDSPTPTVKKKEKDPFSKKNIKKFMKEKKEKKNLGLDEVVLKMIDSKITEDSLPIIYRDEVNITFLGFEKFHPFDPAKYRHISENLVKEGYLKKNQFIKAKICTKEQLLTVHTEEYLNKLSNSEYLAGVVELPPVAYVPNFLLQWKLLTPMWYQVGATILGGEIALKYGWCICLSGGMHHASSNEGGGWCVYSDIPISIRSLSEQGKIKKSMIIDLDAHQGNGHENDKLDGLITDDNNDVFIFDCYNKNGYPGDHEAKKGIDIDMPITSSWNDDTYLSKLKTNLDNSFKLFQPDIVYYNAGSDILDTDPLGGLSISSEGITERDELVFDICLKNKAPIVMVLSGGYSKENARVITDSIENMMKKLNLAEIAKDSFEKNVSKK
eukprot:gene9916-2238_t